MVFIVSNQIKFGLVCNWKAELTRQSKVYLCVALKVSPRGQAGCRKIKSLERKGQIFQQGIEYQLHVLDSRNQKAENHKIVK